MWNRRAKPSKPAFPFCDPGSVNQGRNAGSPTHRRLLIFAGVSIALHVLLAATVLVVPGLLNLPGQKSPQENAPLPSIEFVMVQQEGFGKPTAPDTPDRPSPEAAQERPRQESPPKQEPSPPAPVQPPADDAGAEAAAALPPAPPAPPRPRQVTAAPVPPAAQPAPKADPAPVINLGGTDSLSSLIATGEQMIPVGIDAKFRNREPVYPNEAARRGQHGLVVVQAHVSPDGHAEAVDIEKSSGYALLDEAARDAVITWHFHPAIDSGVPVQSTISISIDFTLR
jgi:protein TonB